MQKYEFSARNDRKIIKSAKNRYRLEKKRISPLLLNENSIGDIFSNSEIKKHINIYNNDSLKDKIKRRNLWKLKYEENKMKKNKSLNIDKNIIVTHISFTTNNNNKKKKKEFKEESTNTYNKKANFNHINTENSLYSFAPEVKDNLSYDKNKRKNTKEKFCLKEKEINYKNRNLTQTNFKLSDRVHHTKSHSNKKLLNNVLLNDNFQKEDEMNRNQIKLFNNIFYFNLLQSLIQNKSNFFVMKNNQSFPSKLIENENDKLNNYNFINYNNNFNLRELYRNLNKQNRNKEKMKKKYQTSFENKIIKNKIKKNHINYSKEKLYLINKKYDEYPNNQMKKIQNLELENFCINRNNFNKYIKNHKTSNQEINCKSRDKKGSKEKKLIKSYFQKRIVKNDILDTGLINSSSQEKIRNKIIFNKFNTNKKATKIQLLNECTKNGIKRNIFNLNNIYPHDCTLLTLMRKKKELDKI